MKYSAYFCSLKRICITKIKAMRHVTVYTTDKEYKHFLALAKSLRYVTKIETDEDSREDILENLKAGFKEVELYKQGKLNTTTAQEFLNELNYA